MAVSRVFSSGMMWFFFFNDTATTEIYTLSLHDALPICHYEMQHQFRSGERVDAVLRLGERLVPVDAKFPLEACQRMLATSGPEQERERRAFARSLKDRIDENADKYIRPGEGTYQFAPMY